MIHQVSWLPIETNLTDRYVGTKFETSGIDQCKFTAIPVRIAIEAVTGSSWHVFNNGDTFAYHSIKKRRFADIRSAHDGYKWLHDALTIPFPLGGYLLPLVGYVQVS